MGILCLAEDSREISSLFFTKGEGGHTSFSADPGRPRRRDSMVSTISLESMGGILQDLHGYIIGTSQRAD